METLESESSDDIEGNTESSPENLAESDKRHLLYGVDSIPPWNYTIFLCFQQFTAMFVSIVTVPFVIAPALCVPSDHPARAYILSTLVFISGLASLLQATFGIRLPIMQGPSASFYAPIFAIMALPQWNCPFDLNSPGIPANYTDDVWESRMRELQGALSVSSVIPIVLSLTGVITIFKKYITPLVVVPTIAAIALSLFETVCTLSSGNWAISISTIILLVAFSQYMSNLMVPYPSFGPVRGCHFARIRWFCFFPIITAVSIMWLVCYILTITDVFATGDAGRTDIKSNILKESAYFRFPYPFQWGIPTVTLASTLGMAAAILATIVESMGDYFACANMCSVKAPPTHAINRGILMEGIACLCAGLWGSGTGTTSYADNIGTIGITRVGSVRVAQITSICMMVAAVFTKLTAVFATLPDPVIGGVYFFTFGMVLAVALSNLQFVDLQSPRNIFVLGFSIFFGFSIGNYIGSTPEVINTGNETADQVFTVLLSTGMLVAGTTAFILDNSVPGTAKERGILFWNPPEVDDDGAAMLSDSDTIYDFPFGLSAFRKPACFRYIPVCPTYVPPNCSSSCASHNNKTDQSETLPKINRCSSSSINGAFDVDGSY